MLTYLPHAFQQMRRRRVTEAHVEAAIASTFEILLTDYPSVRIRGYGEPGRVLKVWFPIGDMNTVRSVAWSNEPDPT